MLVHFSRREYRCQPGLHRPGCGGSTPPSCRVLSGLQALQRCSGLLNRRARGSTVATHHFRIRGEITIILRFERRVCRWESCRMHQFMGMWLNPNSRGSRLRIWQPWGCKSLHAHHFAHVVQCRDSALKTRTVSVQIRPWAPTACSPMQRRSAQTGKVAGASPATRTNLECQPDKRAGPRC